MGSAIANAAPKEALTGSRIGLTAPASIPDSSRLGNADRTRVTLVAFGECAVEHSRALASQLPATPADDPRVSKLLSRLAVGECLRAGEIRMSELLMRGAVFVGLYRASYGKAATPVPSTPTDFKAEVRSPTDLAGQQHIAVRDFADCIARAAPEASRDLVLATPATKREAEAFKTLIPHFGPCMVQGSNVTFSKLVLTGMIAEALFRLASTPSAASAASAG
jgi:hypothetical protein